MDTVFIWPQFINLYHQLSEIFDLQFGVPELATTLARQKKKKSVMIATKWESFLWGNIFPASILDVPPKITMVVSILTLIVFGYKKNARN